MAAATSLAAISSYSWSGRQRFPPTRRSAIREDCPLLGRRIRAFSAREKETRAKLASGFLGQLELRGTVAGPESGRQASRDLLRRRRRLGVARAGVPLISGIPVLGPVLNAFFNPVVLFVLYAAGASRFWSGFQRTSYSNSTPTKVTLTALWPALFLTSAAFRSNFKKAIK